MNFSKRLYDFIDELSLVSGLLWGMILAWVTKETFALLRKICKWVGITLKESASETAFEIILKKMKIYLDERDKKTEERDKKNQEYLHDKMHAFETAVGINEITSLMTLELMEIMFDAIGEKKALEDLKEKYAEMKRKRLEIANNKISHQI